MLELACPRAATAKSCFESVYEGEDASAASQLANWRGIREFPSFCGGRRVVMSGRTGVGGGERGGRVAARAFWAGGRGQACVGGEFAYNINNIRVKMEDQPESSSEEVQFSQEEVVWAKVTGYPWWPAFITEAPADGGSFRVDFFADNTHAFVARSKLAKYQSLRADVDLHKHMKKGLRRAIATADQAVRDHLAASPSLPLAREAVEAVPPTQKQLLQLPSIKTTPLQEHQLPRQQPARSRPTATRLLTDDEQQSHQQQPQSPPTVQYSLEKRKKYVGLLLRKYELDNLTRSDEREGGRTVGRGSEGRSGRKRQATSRREGRKTKKISKLQLNDHQHHLHLHHRPSVLHLLSRRLHHFLKGKSELYESQRRAITLSLAKQVQSHHPRLENAADELTKLLKWLQITPPNTIASYYESWSTFQSEKEKASSMTNEE